MTLPWPSDQVSGKIIIFFFLFVLISLQEISQYQEKLSPAIERLTVVLKEFYAH